MDAAGPLRAHSVRIPPSAVSGSPAPCGWSGRPSSSWSPLLGGRQSAALPVWTFCGAQYLGKTATLVPSRSFARRHMLDTFGRLVGTATPLRRHRRPGQCFAPQLTYPGSSWEQGSYLPYTPTGPLAPVVSLIVSVRAVGYTPTARWTAHAARLIRPQESRQPGAPALRGQRRRVVLDLRSAVDSKQHGRSVPAPWWFGQGPNARQSLRADYTPPTGPVPQPVHEDIGVRD